MKTSWCFIERNPPTILKCGIQLLTVGLSLIRQRLAKFMEASEISIGTTLRSTLPKTVLKYKQEKVYTSNAETCGTNGVFDQNIYS